MRMSTACFAQALQRCTSRVLARFSLIFHEVRQIDKTCNQLIGKHWCLVFVASSFLHLDCLPPSPTKGSLPLKTIGGACRQQAQALMQALILYAHERLQLGQRVEDIFAYVFAKQQTVMAT